MDETIVVSAIIEKLSFNWKDMKRSLKHKKEEITLEGLATILRLEEHYRSQDENKVHDGNKIHMVEEGKSSDNPSHGHNESNKRKRNHEENDSKTRKGECYYCHKMGHFKSECRILKKKQSNGQVSKERFTA